MGETQYTTKPTSVEEIVRLAALELRAKISELADITTLEIQARIPEYARPGDEPYRLAQRAGVEQALLGFLDTLERRPNDTSWRDVYRAIGASERHQGRSLDALQAAIRIGARMGWRQLIEFAEAQALPVGAISEVADAIWTHVDDLASAAADGYSQAHAAEAGELDRRRRRLLDLLVQDPPATEEAIAAAATAARWPLPHRLAAVAIEPSAAHVMPPVFSPEVLVDLDRAEPALIVPDPESRGQVRVLVNSLRRHRGAVGPAVPPGAAGNSWRWARSALDLACRGLIPDDSLVWCDDHLALLTIFQDEALLASVMERRLRPLNKVRPNQREPLADTLLAWLQQNMNASAVAASLHVHPQTVRRRLRQLDRLFGEEVHDCDVRFELEIALRAERARRYERPRHAPRPQIPIINGGRPHLHVLSARRPA